MLYSMARRHAVVFVFIAMYGLCAVAVETVMELVERGGPKAAWVGGDAWALLLAAAALSALLVVDALPKWDMRRQLDRLPFGGRGWRFIALSASIQLAIGLLSQVGSNDGDGGSDVGGSLVVIVMMALLSWLFMRVIGQLMPRLAAAMRPLRLRPHRPRACAPLPCAVVFVAGYSAWPPALFNRPPP